MGNNDYKVNRDSFNVSTTMDNGTKEKKWSIEDMYKSELTAQNLIDVLQVTDALKRKYPNDDIIRDFEEIIRDEICMMFGGTIIENQ